MVYGTGLVRPRRKYLLTIILRMAGSNELHMFKTFGSLASQEYAKTKQSIWVAHDISVCEGNADGAVTKKTISYISLNNYPAQDIVPRETNILLLWK